MKCGLCDVSLDIAEKSLQLVDHLELEHNDVYIHKDNNKAIVDFHIYTETPQYFYIEAGLQSFTGTYN